MFALKRLVKLAVSLLVRACDIVLRRRSCVVLYYHAINPADQRPRFARQMDTLLRLAKPIPADVAALPGDAAHHCAVTFDDGFISVLQNALPELEQRRIPATMFVPTGSLGGPPRWVKPGSSAASQRVMTAEQLGALKDHPLLAIGSHSISHPNFIKLDAATARRELEQSKAQLETILGRKVRVFSFPHGECNATTIELARAAGYDRIFTINPENAFSSADTFVCGRVLADPSDWPLEFHLKVLGAYRWLTKNRLPTTAADSRPPTSDHQATLSTARSS